MEKVFDLKKGKGPLHNRSNDETRSQGDRGNPAEHCSHNVANIMPRNTQRFYIKCVQFFHYLSLYCRSQKLQGKGRVIKPHGYCVSEVFGWIIVVGANKLWRRIQHESIIHYGFQYSQGTPLLAGRPRSYLKEQ
jgi:hypothetical protein